MNQLPELEAGILEYLKESYPRPITAYDLQIELWTGLLDPTSRRIRVAIKRLNDRGYPIVSTRHGFMLAKTWGEIGVYRNNLLRRAKKIMDRVQALDAIPSQGFSVPMVAEAVTA